MGNAFKETTDFGEIVISDDAISEIVLSEIRKYKNSIYITNSKGKRTSKVYKSVGGSSATNIDIISENNVIEIKMYLIFKFGMSIKKTTEELMENIRKQIELATGKNPKSITIVITGMASKKIARRNIEVKKVYDVDWYKNKQFKGHRA